jgi:competence protein ComGC
MLAMETEMKTQRTMRDGRGFVFTELLVVICVIAVLLVVLALLLPALATAKRNPRGPWCVGYLKEISLGATMWANDNNDKFPMQVSVTNGGAMELAVAGDVAGIFRVMSNELSPPKILVCPQDTSRHYATNFTTDFNNQKISYFVGLDAEKKYPQMILSGDDNLAVNGVRVRPGILNLWTNASVGWTKERHGVAGNIALVDGSAQQTTASTLQSALANTGVATNRLVIP